MNRIRLTVAVVALVAGLSSCSGSDEQTPAPTTTPTSHTSTSTPASASTTTPGEAPPAPTTTGKRGADGSTGNNLSDEYCARNQDPGCPAGSYVGPNAIPNPNGDGTWVPCEGTICTNPDHGAGPETTAPPTPPAPTTTTVPPSPSPNTPVEGAACGEDGHGSWVHLDGGNADHYGTEWLCSYNN
ncbi:hypothetical protein ACIGO9_30935 [Nocardia asteroides]|uniref:hypothetical protein n=1 Tax=Nocardia asteroides TaxID=1824 RepID=UPI0037C8A5A8